MRTYGHVGAPDPTLYDALQRHMVCDAVGMVSLKRLVSAFILLTSTAISGCAGIDYRTSMIKPRSAEHLREMRAGKDVEVFAAKRPDEPYEELEIVSIEGGWSHADHDELLTLLRERAGQMGCEGLALLGPALTATDGFADTTYRRERLAGACLVFKTPRPVRTVALKPHEVAPEMQVVDAPPVSCTTLGMTTHNNGFGSRQLASREVRAKAREIGANVVRLLPGDAAAAGFSRETVFEATYFVCKS